MFATASEQRGGILVAVISGGRPELDRRPVHKFLPGAEAVGVHDVIWSVSSHEAGRYERDGHQIAAYPRTWAEEYAAAHWMQPEPPAPGGFLGAFPGREWACREAERRGCWGVLQLDDNIEKLGMLRGTAQSWRLINDAGGLGLFVDLLAGVALSTNARVVGANLEAVNTSSKSAAKVARVGFPYSCFLERVGDGREPWYGPFEDDITHAFQYGTRADGATTALIPPLLYKKEPKSTTGMRAQYNLTRSVQLQRMFPEGAKLAVRATRSNGRGDPRVFHAMRRGALSNPLIIRDHALFGRVRDSLTELIGRWYASEAIANRDKVRRRTGR